MFSGVLTLALTSAALVNVVSAIGITPVVCNVTSVEKWVRLSAAFLSHQ
jgi:hypothetical protein